MEAPSLYVLDSIVKNVGTPYTVYLGRNLYRTFMDAYLVVDQATRKAMEGLLRTWKQSVPESMDPRPVFPANVTGDIENAVNKIRTVAAQTQVPRPMHALPARPPSNVAWRDTSTPPQNMPRYPAPNDPRRPAGLPPTLSMVLLFLQPRRQCPSSSSFRVLNQCRRSIWLT